ncbi:sulfotransferase family protein [Spirillospora sp. NPDC048911]|uniref:sulfotransferase family protein n=1 Tax=Spirillospora sp. NPDC048911 TaxID=3364527 RepID=UPI00372118EF
MTAWRPPERTPAAAQIYAAAEADRAARPGAYTLDPETIIAKATGLDESGGWRQGLERYLESAREDGRLNAVGIRMVRDSAVSALRARVAMSGMPGADARLDPPPIFITGGWRTGTTFLFRLLATDPRLRAPLPAELSVPWKFAGASPDRRRELIDGSGKAFALLDLLNPALKAVHDYGPHLPEECVVGLGSAFRNWGYSATVRLDGYTRWLADENLTGTYLGYRHILHTLDDGRRWLLKAPAHTAELASLAAAFPDARVVFLHRDIVETVASGASLFSVFRSTYSDEVDPADVGRFQAGQTELWLRRAHAFRSSPQAADLTIIDVRYDDLVHATGDVLDRVYTAAGLAQPDLHAMIDAYHAANPPNQRKPHRYTPQEFALDETDLRARLTPWTSREV